MSHVHQIPITLEAVLAGKRTLPIPYTEIGEMEYEGERVMAGVPINLIGLFIFIGERRFVIKMENLINAVLPTLVEIKEAADAEEAKEAQKEG